MTKLFLFVKMAEKHGSVLVHSLSILEVEKSMIERFIFICVDNILFVICFRCLTVMALS